MRHKRKIAVIGAVLGMTILFSAESCDKANEPFKDAKRGDVNSEPADTGTMPDGFNNYATKCDHGHRVYTLFHSDSAYGGIFVVEDKECASEYFGE